MDKQFCDRCRVQVATILGVPITARLAQHPDGSPLAPNEIYTRHEPETWMRLCDSCSGQAMSAGELALTFEIATWRPSREPDRGPT